MASGDKNSPETPDSKISPKTTTAPLLEKVDRELTDEEVQEAIQRTLHIFTPERQAAMDQRVIEASRRARQRSEEFRRRMEEEAEQEKQQRQHDNPNHQE